MNVYDVFLRFTVATAVPAPADVRADLDRRLNNWSDGRYPLHVEMMHEGLVQTFRYASDIASYVHIMEGGGDALVVVEELPPERADAWRVLCRDDRQPDGSPGAYALDSHFFAVADAARDYASGISPSRFPFIVEAKKADAVLTVLNMKLEHYL